MSTSRRAPGEGRYAQLEREQRWALLRVPEEATAPRPIVDRYLHGTQLRLRTVEHDGTLVRKLGQKVRIDVASPERVKLTNMYLTEAEHEVLAGLPAAELRKTRWWLPHHGHVLAIDEFHGELTGLLLAEVELPDLRAVTARYPLGAEVTHDDRFSGGSLASASPADVRALLAEIGAR
jgi:CYTH domain-containing protein